MERLTGRFKDGGAFILPSVVSKLSPMKSEIIEKLASYEDAEEQGLLLRLPCPIGTPVYVHAPFCEICESDYPCEFCTKSPFVSETKFDYEMIPLVGELVFLTKEEAEKSLADMGV